MRYLALDIGDKRTGVAASDSQTRIVTPLDAIEVPLTLRDGKDLLEAIARVVESQVGGPRTPGDIVVGLPLNMDGTEGPRAKLVRAFGDRLAARTRRSVHYQDERLTSAAADWSMARSGLTHGGKKARRDGLAAAAILTDFLEQHPSRP